MLPFDRLKQLCPSASTWSSAVKTATPWVPLALVVFAIVYYATYYRSGLNLGGEGGTTAVLAMRLLEGQRPIVDTFLGYNVLWFYPVAALFHLTGPDYITLRVYFFALCTATALLGYFTVLRTTKRPVLATTVGVILVLIPGMMFRNYMGFLGVLNIFAMFHAFILPASSGRRLGWVVVSAGVLALTFLIRIDIGVFLTPVWVGLLLAQLFGDWRGLPRRLGLVCGALVLSGIAFAALHAPVFWDAHRRGFAESLAGQYTAIFSYVRYEAEQKILKPLLHKPAPVPPQEPGPPQSSDVEAVSQSPASAADASVAVKAQADETQDAEAPGSGTRPRPSLVDIFKERSFYDATFTLIIYLPVLTASLLLGIGGIAFLVGIWKGSEALRRDAMVLGGGTGAALAFFPQYFFFRPDTPHLSEFMCSFLVAMACSSAVIYRWIQTQSTRPVVWAGFFVIGLCGTNAGLYVYHSFPKESAGTAAAGRKRQVEFHGQNGVNVFLRPLDASAMQRLHDVIMAHSDPDDWVICYPYSPTINFMTNRRSYEYNLYVDNATAPRSFDSEAIEKLKTFRPAVVVIDNKEVNALKVSRFRIWAKDTYDFIRSQYIYMGTFRRNEVYVRPDKVKASFPETSEAG